MTSDPTETLADWFVPLQARVNQWLARERLPHGLLVVGGAGLGADSVLAWWARRLLCHTGQASPCGHCQACHLLASGSHTDLRLLEPTGQGQVITIDQVRQLIDFAQGTAQIGRTKLIILHRADRLNPAAANALLKVLEEPPDNTYLVLSTALPQKLLPTVRSRLQTLRLPLPDAVAGREWLVAQGVPEADAEALRVLHNDALWAARDSHAQGILQTRNSALQALIGQLESPDPFLSVLAELAQLTPGHVLKVWQVLVHEMLRASLGRRTGHQISVPADAYAPARQRLLTRYPDPAFWADLGYRIEKLDQDHATGHHYNWRTLLDVFWIETGRQARAIQRQTVNRSSQRI